MTSPDLQSKPTDHCPVPRKSPARIKLIIRDPSKLAVELALRFGGEVINADAMQIYKGLPIMTNKMTTIEQRGVPHHLLGALDEEQDIWPVSKFKSEATEIIHAIRQRGRLPIVVGGTHYYIDSLLFNCYAVPTDEEQPKEGEGEDYQGSAEHHPLLDGPPELILRRLREVDPVMADRWHPNETRKIRRSLEIYVQTGRRASDIYAEQERQRVERKKSNASWPALIFWVYTEPTTLEDRLRKRVDKMMGRGLLAEAEAKFDRLRELEANGTHVDKSKGIWQSVGMSDLEPFLNSAGRNKSLLGDCLEAMKVSTRKCAKNQLRWIRGKTIPALEEAGAKDCLYLVDTTDLSQWGANVVEPAAQVVGKYLDGAALPAPMSLSTTAQNVLVDSSHRKGVPCRKFCDVCKRPFTILQEWEAHLASRPHRRAVAGARRRALVVVAPDVEADAVSG